MGLDVQKSGAKYAQKSAHTPRAKARSKRVWADNFPVMVLVEFGAFVVVDRAALRERLDKASGGGGIKGSPDKFYHLSLRSTLASSRSSVPGMGVG